MTSAPAIGREAAPREFEWYRAFKRTCEIARKWIHNTRGILEYLLTHMPRGAREWKVPDWEIARFLGCSVRWVQKGLKTLEDWGVISRYWHHDRAKHCGRVIVLLVFPKGWFATDEDRKQSRKAKPKGEGPVNTSYTPVTPPTAAELERARPATPEEIAQAEAKDREHDARARALWESLSADQRRAIEDMAAAEDKGFSRLRWPKLFAARCMGLALELHEAGRPIEPRAP